MNEKKWYLSKGVIGGLVAGLATIAGLFGYNVGLEGQEEITTGIVTLVGAGLAIYGRVKAVDKIK